MNSTFLDNQYIKACDSSAFTVLFNNFNDNDKIRFIHALLDYGDWNSSVDLFRYVTNLDELRRSNKTYFVFDASTEGFSPFEFSFFDILYNGCNKHNISPSKVIFVSSNLYDKQNLSNYNTTYNIKDDNSIRCFCFCSFRKMMSDLIEDNYGLDITADKMLNIMQRQTKKNYNGKIGLSLSRVNRPHRSLANYLLYQNNLSYYFLQSNNKLDKSEINFLKNCYSLDDNFSKWCASLPLIADTQDFETNHALNLHSNLHTSVLFQIVNETHVDNWNNTSLFFSEKTFRAIAFMQPFVIFGQPNCNQKLEDLGFKLFHEFFDYGFDSINNTQERYNKLIMSITKFIERAKNLPLDEQISLRFSVSNKLKHNFDLLMNSNFEKDNFKKLILSL